MNELKIMALFDHPNIAMLHTVLQDKKYIYFVMELLRGGELFRHMKMNQRLQENWVKFYAASVILAFSQIHACKVVYRDLKPENIVLDDFGYAKIVDFGLAKELEEGRTWTICGTPDYLAPEVITIAGHDYAVDFWTLGIFIYELASGSAPFASSGPMEAYEQILSGVISYPDYFGKSIIDIIKKFFKQQPVERLGNTKGGIHAVQTHKWFTGFDWDGLYQRNLNKNQIPIRVELMDVKDIKRSETVLDSDNCPESKWFPDLPDMLGVHQDRVHKLMSSTEVSKS